MPLPLVSGIVGQENDRKMHNRRVRGPESRFVRVQLSFPASASPSRSPLLHLVVVKGHAVVAAGCLGKDLCIELVMDRMNAPSQKTNCMKPGCEEPNW